MAVPGVQEETSFRTLKAYGLGPGPAGAFRDTPPSPGAAPPNVNDLTDGARSGKNYGGNPGNRSMP